MKNECNIVRDILPLYVEDMVSEETAKFVKEHLENCPECTKEFEDMKAGTKVKEISSGTQNHLEEEVLKSMQTIRKRFQKKAIRVGAIIAAIVIALGVLIHIFPVYRILHIGLDDYYSTEQIIKALYIGSASDRREAQSVLRLADKAFMDVRSTREENEEEYGLLARYATVKSDHYADVAFNEHSLELWSAHLDEDEGWIWVFYSSETFNHDGSTACGSWRVPSLWKVEKNDIGEWVVVQIREHP